MDPNSSLADEPNDPVTVGLAELLLPPDEIPSSVCGGVFYTGFLPSSAEEWSVVIVTLASAVIQASFIRNAEENLNPHDRYQLGVNVFLAAVFVGYAVVNLDFAKNAVSRLQWKSKNGLGLSSDLDGLEYQKIFELLDKSLPIGSFGVDAPYLPTAPLRGFFIATELILSIFAVILNVASFYVACASKEMNALEQNLLIVLGIIISLPYVGLNLIPTEKVSTFLMSMISREENSSQENSLGIYDCAKWLLSQIPAPKEAGMLLLVSIIDALHAVQAFGYTEILAKGVFPVWFDKLMKQELLIAIINFLFLYSTKFDKTKKLLYWICNFQQDSIQESAQQDRKLNYPLALLSFIVGLAMAAKAFAPSYTTFRDILTSNDGDPESLESIGFKIAVYLLTVGSGVAPAAFYSICFYNAIDKYICSRSSSGIVSEPDLSQVHSLLKRLYGKVTNEGVLSRNIAVNNLGPFLWSPELMESQDKSFILSMVAHLSRAIDQRGRQPSIEVSQTLKDQLAALACSSQQSSALVEFNCLMEELTKKENYNNGWLNVLAFIFCGAYSMVSSFGYGALLMNSIEGFLALKNTLASLLALSFYVLFHERIGYRLGQLLDRLKDFLLPVSDALSGEGKFHYASLSPKVVHSLSAGATLVVVLEMLAGLVGFAYTSSWCASNDMKKFILVVGTLMTSVLTPYLCLPLDLYFTNGPTKNYRHLLMGCLSRPMVASMLCNSGDQQGVPSNFSGVSSLLAGFDWLYTTCLAWSVLGGEKELFASIALLYFSFSAISLPGRILSSGRMFNAFFLSTEAGNAESVEDSDQVSGRSLVINADLSAESGELNNEGVGSGGIVICRVLSDLLSGWIKSVFFISHLNPQTVLVSAEVMTLSVILSLMMLVGREVVEGKGDPFNNKRRLFGFGLPRSPSGARNRLSPVNTINTIPSPRERDGSSPVYFSSPPAGNGFATTAGGVV